MKRKANGLAFIFVSGILAYLALAIMFWQSAWAAPLSAQSNELSFDSLGSMYELHTSESKSDTTIAFSYVHGAVLGSIHTRAMTECAIDGDTDFPCYKQRYETLLNYVALTVREATGNATNENLVQVFFNWAVNAEIDEVVEVGFASAIFVSVVVDGHEKSQ